MNSVLSRFVRAFKPIFTNFKIKQMIFAYSAILILLMFFIGLIGYLSINSNLKNSEDMYKKRISLLTIITDMRGQIGFIQAYSITYLTSPLSLSDRLSIDEKYRSHNAEFDKLYISFINSNPDSYQLEFMSKINNNIIKFRSLFEDSKKVYKTKGSKEAYVLYDTKAFGLINESEILMKDLANNASEDAQTQNEKQNADANKSKTFILIFLLLAVFLSIILSYFIVTKIINSIVLVTKKLTEISEIEDIHLDNKIEIRSKDEIGDLVTSFNKIQDKVKKQIETIKNTFSTLLQQEKLASIGILMGGIAHNLKTPLLVISATSESLESLVNEYKTSINDKNVSIEDHFEIAEDMISKVDRIKSQTGYMVDIIAAVREQISNSSSSMSKFSIKEMVSRVNILMKSELSKNRCTLDFILNTEEKTFIKGDLGSLIQVLNNTIGNSIQSYEGNKGKIEVFIDKVESKIIIKVCDYGKGIPESVKEKLFKEMVTTKGKDSSGIGLYVSYSTIKAVFKGDMLIDSEERKGTTVTIEVNEY